MSNRAVFAAAYLLAAACGTDAELPGDDGDDVDDVDDSSDDVGDSDDDPTPEPPTAATAYVLVSDLDVPADALLPQQGYDLTSTIRNLRNDPGKTIFQLLDQAGVPLLADLKAALPSTLESKLEGWVGDAIESTGVLSNLDPVVAAIDTVIADIDMTSTLSVAGRHRVDALRFSALGNGVDVPIAALDPLLTFEVEATVTVDGTSMIVGDHAFGLPLGDLAWIALESELGDVRELLGEAVDCPAMAARVAGMGVGPVEVGHEADLTSLCESGLDLVEQKIYEQVAAMNWDAIHFSTGTATLVDADADADGVGEALALGRWTATIDAGQGPRAVPGVFSGQSVE